MHRLLRGTLVVRHRFASFVLLVIFVFVSGCGAFSDADDRIFSSDRRSAEPAESLSLALATSNPALCHQVRSV